MNSNQLDDILMTIPPSSRAGFRRAGFFLKRREVLSCPSCGRYKFYNPVLIIRNAQGAIGVPKIPSDDLICANCGLVVNEDIVKKMRPLDDFKGNLEVEPVASFVSPPKKVLEDLGHNKQQNNEAQTLNEPNYI